MTNTKQIADSFESFFSAIKSSNKPVTNIIKISELYNLYLKFCRLHGIDSILSSSIFWERVRQEYPLLNIEDTHITLGDLKNLAKICELLKARKIAMDLTFNYYDSAITFEPFIRYLLQITANRYRIIPGLCLYHEYSNFCRIKGYNIMLDPIRFWDMMQSILPEINPREYYRTNVLHQMIKSRIQ